MMTVVTARLERVRGSMSDADFARLLADVERTIQRFEEIDAREHRRLRAIADRATPTR